MLRLGLERREAKMVDIKNEDMARNNIEIYLINKINVCY